MIEKAREFMTDKTLQVCLKDLESMDLLLNTMRNPYKETQYAIRSLGLEYMKDLEK